MGMYPVLVAGERKAELAGVCALAVMAKAPRAGKVKTRLAPVLGFEGSAAINVCFLRDTTRNIAEIGAGTAMMRAEWQANIPEAREGTPASEVRNSRVRDSRVRDSKVAGVGGAAQGLVCYTPVGDEVAFDGLLPEDFALIAQRGDAFGERLLAAAEDILSCGFGAICLIDSDSPTMPAAALRQAVEELARPGDRVVLGGSDDGGYYLIGLKQAHATPFERITWSTASVYAETAERCKEAGLELVELPVWYDVDDAATLAVLEAELLRGERPGFAAIDGYDATATRAFLAERAR
jgi:glycosyltransferase A (GT-A) superfamily protein (DUF2064 family)